MSYIHDLTTTALNLIDARRNLEADGFASANHSKYATFDNLLAIVSRCSSIPRCDISVLGERVERSRSGSRPWSGVRGNLVPLVCRE